MTFFLLKKTFFHYFGFFVCSDKGLSPNLVEHISIEVVCVAFVWVDDKQEDGALCNVLMQSHKVKCEAGIKESQWQGFRHVVNKM